MRVRERLERLDRFQQQHEKLGIAAATVKKFTDDRSTNLASMIAFWAIFSIFPLFLVLVTILGYVLSEQTRTDVLEHVSSYFPLLDPTTVEGLAGSWWPILLGGLTAFWSGSAVVRTTQVAFNSVWGIPPRERPGFLEKTLRSLSVLGTVGLGLVAATIVSGYVTGQSTGWDLGWFGRLAGQLITLAVDIGLFVAAFRMLTDRKITWRDVLPGAFLSGGMFWILQQVSSLIISRYLTSAQSTYGNFATVITVLWWFYLQAQITLLGAQLNVVLKKGLHPRSLLDEPGRAHAAEATGREREEVDGRHEEGRLEEPRRSARGRPR
jgi:YihY family inner membrane protein